MSSTGVDVPGVFVTQRSASPESQTHGASAPPPKPLPAIRTSFDESSNLPWRPIPSESCDSSLAAPTSNSSQDSGDSWRSLLSPISPNSNDASPCSELFLGPHGLDLMPSVESTTLFDDQFVPHGQRADLFAQPKSPVASDALGMSIHPVRSCSSASMRSGDQVPKEMIASDDAARQEDSPRTYMHIVDAVPKKHLLEELDEENRRNWPTSSRFRRHTMHEASSQTKEQVMRRLLSPELALQDSLTPPAESDARAPRADAASPTDTRVHFWVTLSKDQYIVSVYLPGFEFEGITLTTKGFNQRTLHITANRWTAEGSEHFERRITFGADALMERMRASFREMTLKIYIPRRYDADASDDRPRKYAALPSLAGQDMRVS